MNSKPFNYISVSAAATQILVDMCFHSKTYKSCQH